MDRASDYGSEGWGFKSLRARHRIQQELFFLSGLPRWMAKRVASGGGDLDQGGQSGDVTTMFADLSDPRR